MSQPYLFYSDRDPNSKQIIETLKALNKVGLYKFIDALTLQPNQRPQWLTKVPTLYIPDTKEVVVGNDILDTSPSRQILVRNCLQGQQMVAQIHKTR
jgi:hypothetical protein